MKNYIKPTFTLAGLAPVAFAAGKCNVKLNADDLTVLYEQLDITDPTQAFMESEDCVAAIPDGLTQYCKFTSVGTVGIGVVLGS